MTDVVKVAEWISERGLYLEPFTMDNLGDGFVTLYIFQETSWDGEPHGSWEKLEGKLKRGLFYTDEGVAFWVVKEEE